MEQPKIPTLKDSQKPQVKIKGLAAGMSLFDRLKQFKKKDLAFILAGLGTLFMAPLAEHFMMAPESGDGTMQQGWGGKGGSNLFGSGSSPYESGITGLAPGGAIGGGGDVITPLNVRDPSALVMGPGMTQQPPAGSLAPQTPPPAQKEPDLKDALANAAARAAGAATRKAPVPVPKPAIAGSGLRGLGVISGGSSAGAGLAPINSAGLSTNKAAGSNSLSDVRPASNYRGVARGPGSGSSADRLRQAGGNAADLFNQKGAASSLDQAAQVAMPGNGNAFGGGNGGAGKDDKGPGGNNSNGSKSVGESLEFLRQKQEMEKALDLKWKMKEKRAMFPLELQQEAAKAIVMDGVVKPLAGGFGELMKASFGPSSTQVFMCAEGNVPVSEVSMSGDRGCAGKKYYQSTDARGITLNRCGSDKSAGGGAAYTGCRLGATGGSAAGGAPPPEQRLPEDPLSGVNPQTRAATGRADGACTALNNGQGLAGADLERAQTLNAQARAVVTARNSLQGGTGSCGAETVAAGTSADGQLSVAEAKLRNAVNSLMTQNGGAAAAYQRPTTLLTEAAAALTSASQQIGAARTALNSPVGTTSPQAPTAYFGQATNPFGTTGDASTWFTQFKESQAPLPQMITDMEARVTRLRAVTGDVNLAAGEESKPGVVERSMRAFSAYQASKAVADAATPELAKPLYEGAAASGGAAETPGARATNEAARTALTGAAPTGQNANQNVTAAVANFITAGQAVAPQIQTADQALLRYADPNNTAVAGMAPLAANQTAQQAAQAAVETLRTPIGTSLQEGLRKSAGDILVEVNRNLVNSRNGPASGATPQPAQQ